MLIIAIGLTILFGILIAAYGAKYNKEKKDKLETFINNEREADFARRRDIEERYFHIPDTSSLPLREYSEPCTLARKQDEVLKWAGKRMLRFDRRMTNTELKLSYGRANLENIIVYEENYSAYIRALTDWAGELFAEQEDRDGVLILEKCVRLGSELSKSYTILADAYDKENNAERLSALYETVENNTYLNSVTKERILTHIKRISSK